MLSLEWRIPASLAEVVQAIDPNKDSPISPTKLKEVVNKISPSARQANHDPSGTLKHGGDVMLKAVNSTLQPLREQHQRNGPLAALTYGLVSAVSLTRALPALKRKSLNSIRTKRTTPSYMSGLPYHVPMVRNVSTAKIASEIKKPHINGFSLNPKIAKEGLLKGLDPSEPNALEQVKTLVEKNNLILIGRGDLNSAYALPPPYSEWVLKIPRFGQGGLNVTKKEMLAMESAARLGLGPSVNWNASSYFPPRKAYLVQQKASGQTLGSLLRSNSLSDNAREEISLNIVKHTAQLNRHGWSNGDMGLSNLIIILICIKNVIN
jgi:hypothetical protein